MLGSLGFIVMAGGTVVVVKSRSRTAPTSIERLAATADWMAPRISTSFTELPAGRLAVRCNLEVYDAFQDTPAP